MVSVTQLVACYAVAVIFVLVFFVSRGKLNWRGQQQSFDIIAVLENSTFLHRIPVVVIQPPNSSSVIFDLSRRHPFGQHETLHQSPTPNLKAERYHETVVISFPNKTHSSTWIGDTNSSPIAVREQTRSPGNVFLHHVNRAIKKDTDIVLFDGHAVKRIFGIPGSHQANIELNAKIKVRNWGDLAEIIIKKNSTLSHAGLVHVHNEIKIGDLLELIERQYKLMVKRGTISKALPGILPIETFQRAMDLGQPPVVFTNGVDENWGFFSTRVGTRTTKWINMTNHLIIHNSNYNTVKAFLDSDKVVLMTCNTHVDPSIGYHPKIISLPLGAGKSQKSLYKTMQKLLGMNLTKTKLLVINNSGWGDRSVINEQVSRNFNGSITNSYRKYDHGQNRDTFMFAHYKDLAQAKFVLCPSGLGFDTYRLWESMILGSIPVVESNAGFDRTYASLPVLVVRNYTDLNPDLLIRAYPCFENNAGRFRYEHLTQSYWLSLVSTAIKTGSIEHIMRNHPPVNPYCSYM